jgi:tetratricopeptide (TPR) repeat protein
MLATDGRPSRSSDDEDGARAADEAESQDPPRPPGAQSPDELLARARRLAADGRYDDIAAAVADEAEVWSGEDGADAALAEIASLLPRGGPAWCTVAAWEVHSLLEAEDLSQAMEKAQEIHRHVEARAEAEPDSAARQDELWASYRRLGAIAASGEDPAAVAYLEAALGICRRSAAADPTDADRQWDLALAHEELADTATVAGDARTAGRHYRAAVHIRQTFATANPTDESWAMALSLGRRSLSVFEENLAAGVRYYESAVRTTQRLSAAHPETLRFQLDLAASHEALGDLAMAGDDPARAHHHYRTAVDVASHLDATGTPAEQWELDPPPFAARCASQEDEARSDGVQLVGCDSTDRRAGRDRRRIRSGEPVGAAGIEPATARV